MGRATRGCGCAIAVLVVLLGAGVFLGYRYLLPWWKKKPPPPSGELTVRVLDVGPVNGDSILITSAGGKTVLIDAGDTSKGKLVIEALKRNNVQQLDYLIITHPHPDHMGGAAEVFKTVKVVNVIDNGQPPAVPPDLAAIPKASPAARKSNSNKPLKTSSITKFYDDYKQAVAGSGAHYEKAAGNEVRLRQRRTAHIIGPHRASVYQGSHEVWWKRD